jgi:hypothetical protein
VEGTLNGVVLLIMKRTFNDFPAGLKRDSSHAFNTSPHPTPLR